MPNVTPPSALVHRDSCQASPSGSTPTCGGRLVGRGDLAARARLDELQHDAIDGDRIEVVLVVRRRGPGARGSGGSGSSAAPPTPRVASRLFRSSSDASPDDQHRIAVGELRVRAGVAGEFGIAAPLLRRVEAHETHVVIRARTGEPRGDLVARIVGADRGSPDDDLDALVRRGDARAKRRTRRTPGRLEAAARRRRRSRGRARVAAVRAA